MKAILIYIISAITLFSNIVIAQDQIRPLKIGDKVPNLEFRDVLFHAKSSMKLSDFKGKLVILDFWSTTCAPCIAAMPKYDALQRKYGDKIVILPVISAKDGLLDRLKVKIQDFWPKNRFTKNTSLPTVVDTVLAKYFPHGGLPYEVWINGNGVLVGLTQFINEKEIESALAGSRVSVESKYSDTIKYDYKKPLLNLYSKDLSSTLFYTAITPYLKIAGGSKKWTYGYDSLKNTSKFSAVNQPNLTLLTRPILINRLGVVSDNRVLLEVKDSSQYILPAGEYVENWQRETWHSYEAVVPGKITQQDMEAKMRNDMASFLNVTARFEERLVDCWALVRTSKNDALLTSSKKERLGTFGKLGTPEMFYYTPETKSVTDVFSTIKELVDKLNYMLYFESTAEGGYGIHRASKWPVIDESGVSKEVRIVIDRIVKDGKIDRKSIFTVEYLRSQLKQHGLDLVPVKRELEMFVITEKDYKKPI